MNIVWLVSVPPPTLRRNMGEKELPRDTWIEPLAHFAIKQNPSWRITIITEGNTLGRAESCGITYHSVGSSSWRWYKPFPSQKFVAMVSSIVKEADPALIHIFGTESIWASLSTKLWRGIPCVVSLQGILNALWPVYNGGIRWYESIRYYRLSDIFNRRPPIELVKLYWRYVLARRERKVLRCARYIIGRTQFDKEWSRKLAPNAQYFHVGEILRPEFYAATTCNAVVRPKRLVLYCGAAFKYPLKGGHLLLQTLAKFGEHIPKIELRVADAINLKGQYQRYLEDLVTEFGIKVVRLPELSATDVIRELRNCTYFVLPSLGENSPNSLMEAIILKTPIITTTVGGIRSIMPPNRLPSPKEVVEQLSKAYAYIMQDQNRMDRI